MLIVWQEYKSLDKSTNHATQTEMIRNMKILGHDIQYYCTYKYKKEYYGLSPKEIRYLSMPKIPKVGGLVFFCKMIFKNLTILLRTKPDVIIVDNVIFLAALPSIIVMRASRIRTKVLLDVRTLPTDNNPVVSKAKMALLHFVLKLADTYADGLSFISPFMKEYLLRRRMNSLPVVVWTSGVNERLFDPDLYSRCQGSSPSFALLYHGGLSISRGVLEIMQAVCLLKRRGLDIRLRLIGNIVDKKEIFDFYRTRNMSDYCQIHDRVAIEKIPIYISNCDLAVIPFPDFLEWRVSSPLKLFEYLAMGKPVVVTKIEAFRNVTTGKHDFLYFADSHKAVDLARAIGVAYHERNTFRIKGLRARRFIQNDYTWANQASKLLAFLGILCRGARERV